MSTEKKARKPTYNNMIISAISELKERGGSSFISIAKEIESQYPEVKELSSFRQRLKRALKKGTDEGSLELVRRSYKLSKQTKDVKKRKSMSTEKKIKKKAKKFKVLANDDSDVIHSGAASPYGTEGEERNTESDNEYRKKIQFRVRRRLFDET